jgi:hypothetical protein
METLESPFQATACPRKGISFPKNAHTGIYNVTWRVKNIVNMCRKSNKKRFTHMVRTLPHSQREFSPLCNVMEHTHSYRVHIPTDVDISTYDRARRLKRKNGKEDLG